MSTVIGAPVSGLLLGLDGAMGLKGWQWLFVIEGIPSVLLGIVTWFSLTDRPEKAEWLNSEQKAWLASKLQAEKAAKQAARHLSLAGAVVGESDCAQPDLFRLRRRGLRYAVLAAADRQGIRPDQCADRLRHRNPLSVRHDRHDLVGAALRRYPKAMPVNCPVAIPCSPTPGRTFKLATGFSASLGRSGTRRDSLQFSASTTWI
jgi:hypothetical protein